MGPIATELARRLEAALAPSRLEVIDESAGHRGHGGHNPEGESHLRVLIWAPAFLGDESRGAHACGAERGGRSGERGASACAQRGGTGALSGAGAI